MLVKIKPYDYLYANRSVDPSVNDDMLQMAGEVFEIDDDYIVDNRWYSYNGWKWLGDWLVPFSSETATHTMPKQTITPDITRLLERLKSVVMPSDLQSITIKSSVDEQTHTVNPGNPFAWDLIFLPRESGDLDTQVFVKFKGAVQYNITRYGLRSMVGYTIPTLETREKEDLIPRVLEGLYEAYKDSLITDANVLKTKDALSLGSWGGLVYRIRGSSPRHYRDYQGMEYLAMFSDIVRMTLQETHKLNIQANNHESVLDNTLLDTIYASTDGSLYSMDRATYDTYFKEHTLYTCPVFGVTYFGRDLIKSVFSTGWFDGQYHIYIPTHRPELFEQFDTLYERLADTDHEWSSYPKAIYYGRQWYSQEGYERELKKAEAFLQFNLSLEGQQVRYIPTGDTSYTDDDELIAEYDYEPQLYFHGDNSDLHLGVELEIDKGGESHYNAALIQPVLGWKHAYFMHDGSLNDGFEIGFMPMTLTYAESIKGRFTDALNLASYLGYSSHNTTSCGLHIHFDRSFLGASRKTQNQKASYLAIIMERNWEKFVQFSRRNYSRMEQWAKKMDLVNDIYADDTEDDAQDKFSDKYGNGDKYVALNTAHYNTYELRIFRGTLKPETLFATMQFVDNLVRISKDCNSLAKAQQITFADIIDYKQHKELIEYVNTRGILTREYKEYEGE